MITRFYLIPKKCHFLFGSQKIRPSRLAFALITQIRQKPAFRVLGRALRGCTEQGWWETLLSSPSSYQLWFAVCHLMVPGTHQVLRALIPPNEGQQRTCGGGGGSWGGALSCWPQQRLSQLLALAGAAVAPGQPATMRWKEEVTALFCPKPRN